MVEKKKPKGISGWLELTPAQVEDLDKLGIGMTGAKKDENGKYYTYHFNEKDYKAISKYLKGGV